MIETRVSSVTHKISNHEGYWRLIALWIVFLAMLLTCTCFNSGMVNWPNSVHTLYIWIVATTNHFSLEVNILLLLII